MVTKLGGQKRINPTKSRESDFLCQKLLLGQKLQRFFENFENCADFCDFFIKRQYLDWLSGLPLKTVPTLNGRTEDCVSIKIESEPERLGQVNNGDITKNHLTKTCCDNSRWINCQCNEF